MIATAQIALQIPLTTDLLERFSSIHDGVKDAKVHSIV